MLFYHCVRDISWSLLFSTLVMNIAVLHVYGFQTCFGSAASAFENIELAYIHCALKENFSVTSRKCMVPSPSMSIVRSKRHGSPLSTRFTKSSLSNEGIRNLTALQMTTESKVWFLGIEHKMFGASVIVTNCFMSTTRLQNSRFFFSKSVKKSVKGGVRVLRARA